MRDAEPSTTVQIIWHIHYAEYFAQIGVVAKAKLHVSQAGEIYTRSFKSPKGRINATERAQRILAVAKAGFVLSLISFEETELERAIAHIDYAIRVLKTGITTIERTGGTTKSNSCGYDPFSSDPRPPAEKTETASVGIGSKIWTFKSV